MANLDTIYGLHSVKAVIQNEPERILEIMISKGRNDDRVNELVKNARQQQISLQFVQKKTLDDKAKGQQHQGILARVKPARVKNEADLDRILETADTPLFLILDGVTDPHNLGACLRNCDAAGVNAVIVPKDKSVGITPVVSKVAVGAAEQVPFIQVTNLARTITHLKNNQVWVVGTAGETDTLIYDYKFTGAIALVIGAEGAGMRRLTKESCDDLVKLPMQGSVSSLNVSVACGICLYEILRQRKY